MTNHKPYHGKASALPFNIDYRVIRNWGIAAFTLVCAGLLVTLANIKTATGEPTEALRLTSGAHQNNGNIADLIETVKPAVVNISVSGKRDGRMALRGPQFDFPQGSPFDDFFQHHFGHRNGPGKMPMPEFNAVGSGFVISNDGFVVTNSHVVKNAEKVTVTLDNGKQFKASIEGIDPKTDLALLKIEKAGTYPYVTFGESDKARIGDQIVAIGNPFGLGNTATTGIISARGRDIHSGPFDDFIQIDAPINQGNSGGPLFDMNGKVIGINTAIYSPNGGNVGIGFAIPAAQAKTIVEQLRTRGHVERGWLGIQIQPLTEELADSLDLDEAQGSLIANVTPGSPAKRAGLSIGDVITAFDGQTIKTPKDLTRIVASAKPNRKYTVRIWRDGEAHNLTVVTGLTPDSNQQASIEQKSFESGKAKLGLALAPLNESTRHQYNVGNDVQNGALIVNVASGSPADQNGLQPGDVITRIGNQEINSPDELVEEVKKSTDADQERILLLVSRGANSRFVSLNIA